MGTSESECLEALQEAANRLGDSPTKAQYEELGITPAASTILRVVGGWNAAKEKAGLDTNRSTGSRVAPKPDHVSIPDDETWESLTQDQRWHYKNVEWNSERTLRRRARLRAWLYETKQASSGCTECGESDPACLDYHHDDPDEKTMAVNKMVIHGYGRDALRSELERCSILCANCHRRHHDTFEFSEIGAECTPENLRSLEEGKEQATRAEIRAWTRRTRIEAGCSQCGETDGACLAFHHPDPETKREGIAKMIADGESLRAVRREVAACEVYCANCHRKEHYEVPDPVRESDSI